MKLPSLTLLALFAVWLLQSNAVTEGASLKHYRNVRRARIPRQFIEPSPTAQNTALDYIRVDFMWVCGHGFSTSLADCYGRRVHKIDPYMVVRSHYNI